MPLSCVSILSRVDFSPRGLCLGQRKPKPWPFSWECAFILTLGYLVTIVCDAITGHNEAVQYNFQFAQMKMSPQRHSDHGEFELRKLCVPVANVVELL